jgi:hypothetical protein
VALEEANEAVNNSCIRIICLRKKLNFLPMGLEARSIRGGRPPTQGMDNKTEVPLCPGTKAAGGKLIVMRGMGG